MTETEFEKAIQQKAKTFLDLQIAYRTLFNRKPIRDADKISRIASLNLMNNTLLVQYDVAVAEHNKEVNSWIDAYNKLNDSYQKERDEQKRDIEVLQRDYNILNEVLKSNDVAKSLFDKLQETNAKNDLNFALAEERRLKLDKQKQKLQELLAEFPNPSELPSMFRHKAWAWKKKFDEWMK